MINAQSFHTDKQNFDLSDSILQVCILVCIKKPVDINNFNSHSVQSLTFQFQTQQEVWFYLRVFQWHYYAKGEIGPAGQPLSLL